MKFGRSEVDSGEILSLPPDQLDTKRVLTYANEIVVPEVRFGLPKWGKADLENLYPPSTSNPLLYYSSQFNAIEFNAFFYRIFKPEQVVKWRDSSSPDFKFFPKVPQLISQFRRLRDVEHLMDEFLFSISHFNEKLGSCFLQMHPTFSPESFSDLRSFIQNWPSDLALAVEVRHPSWYGDLEHFNNLCELLEKHNISHILTDTVGRRDLLHMRLTNSTAFVRFTAANHPTDENRIDEWVERLKSWTEQGLERIYFFSHIHAEKESPFIPAMFVEKLNHELNLKLSVPKIMT